MTFYLSAQAETTGLPALDTALPSRGDRFDAAWEAQRLEDDSWQRSQGYADDLLAEITAAVGRPSTDHLKPARSGPYGRYGTGLTFETRVKHALQVVADGRAAGVDGFADLPTTREEFEAEVTRRYRRDYAEAQDILAAAPEGGWGPELAGRLGAGATDEVTLATLPLGAPGRLGLGAKLAIEAAAGATGEALMSGRRNDAADLLGIERPNLAADMAMSGLMSAGLGVVLPEGVMRAVNYRRARTAGRLAAPEGMAPVEAARAVDAAEAELTGSAGALDREIAAVAAERGGAERFDYRAGGNASPRTNRVGYIFGRLVDEGIEPHIAAGIVGNGMVESGPGLMPGAIGDGGNALGLWQWNGPRKRALENFAAARGKPADDIDTQVAFLLHELKGSEKAAWDRVRAARTAEEAAQLFSDHFERPGIPHNGRRIAHARDVFAQYEAGGVPRYSGPASVVDAPADFGPTRRGYTRPGEVAVGDDMRVSVQYEVVDLASLKQATGRFQPRDRAQINSDDWVAATAARLDPAQLMPSPNAATGTPLVGPDGMIESGNGRVRVLTRAYDRMPDRAAEYRATIERAGFDIPEGVERPVLIARRTTDLDDDARAALTVAAQDSGVAAMTPAELSGVVARALDPDVLARLTPGAKIKAAANQPFAQAILSRLSKGARNALYDGRGALNADGVAMIRRGLFARAWDARDIVALAVDPEEAGALRGLIAALDDAAPAMATLRAEIERGLVRAEFDISGHVAEAVRLIAAAQVRAGKGEEFARVIAELLDEPDLLDGALSPLTVALVRRFWNGNRPAATDGVARLLSRYAEEARVAGRVGDADPIGPADILRRIDKDAFGDLPDDIGAPRPVAMRGQAAEPALPDLPEAAYGRGADSPEAVEADQLAAVDLREAETGAFGPVIAGLENRPEEAIARLVAEETGEVTGAFSRPELGAVDFVWGKADGPSGKGGFGIAHIAHDGPEGILEDVPRILREGAVYDDPKGLPRAFVVAPGKVGGAGRFAVVRLDWDGRRKTWLVTAVEDNWGKFDDRAQWEAYRRTEIVEARDPASPGPDQYRAAPDAGQDDIARSLSEARAELGDLTLRAEDGSEITAADMLDEIEADQNLAEILRLCNIGGSAP